MSCMKCGRETDAGQIFCEECLTQMEKYPVKPDTAVLLPKRRDGFGAKKIHQRRQTPEEQIAALEKRCRRLVAALLATVVLLLGISAAAGITIYEWDMNRFLGQNYTTIEETTGAVNCDH